MKKQIVLFIVIGMLVGCFSSCAWDYVNSQESDLAGTSTRENLEIASELEIVSELVLEPDKQDLPEHDAFSLIEIGMTEKQVYELLGNPQRTEKRRIPMRPGTSVAYDQQCYIYDSTDGRSLLISYSVTGVYSEWFVSYLQLLDPVESESES